MKRYLAFAYPVFYPSGGMSDLVGSYDDIGDALTALRECYYPPTEVYSGGHIYNCETGEKVFFYYNMETVTP